MAWILLLCGAVFIWWKVTEAEEARELERRHKEEKQRIAKQEYLERVRDPLSNHRRPPKDAWNERREYVLQRDGYSCRNCGGTAGLQVHHVVPVSVRFDHSVDNLKTLCIDCHSKEHGRDLAPAAAKTNRFPLPGETQGGSTNRVVSARYLVAAVPPLRRRRKRA